MITSQSYLDRFHEIKHLDYSSYRSNPDKEKIFYVDLDSRQITIPTQFQDLAVVGDHLAETVWFAVNRYYDGEDLSTKTWGVQVLDAASRSLLLFIEKKRSPITTADLNTTNTTLIGGEDMLLLGWPITLDVTNTAGSISFSLCCFDLEDQGETTSIKYRLGTESISCQIKDSIYITDASENLVPNASRIEQLIETANELLGDAGNISITYDQIQKDTRPKIDGVELRENTSSDEFKINYNSLQNKPTYYIDGQMFLRSENSYSFDSANFKNIDFMQILNPPTMNGEVLTGENDICYQNLADKPVIQTDEEGFIIGIDEYEISKVKVDDALNAESINPVQNQAITNQLSTMNESITKNQSDIVTLTERINEMSVVPISIEEFATNQSLFEIGYTTGENDLIFSWYLSKDPSTLTINSETMENIQEGAFAWPAGLDESTAFTLEATSIGSKAKATLNVDFTHRIYHGAATIPAAFNKDFIDTLTSQLQTSQTGSFNVTALDAQYIYYAVPTEYGDCSFSYGGFTGGFKRVADKIKIINNYGVEIEYDFYQSDNPSLGVATIVVAKKGE